MSFAVDLTKFAKKTQDRQDILVRKLVLEVYRRIVQRTPVDRGRAQNNWNVDQDRPDLTTTEGTATETDAISRGMAKIEKFSSGGVIWITNNLPYIVPLEEGHSTQTPPGGIVEITLQEFEQIVRLANATAKSQKP